MLDRNTHPNGRRFQRRDCSPDPEQTPEIPPQQGQQRLGFGDEGERAAGQAAGKSGDGGEEVAGVRVLRLAKDFLGGSDFDELASPDAAHALRALATRKRNDKLECRVGGREADDFYVLEPGFAARGKDIVFRDVRLALGIDDPESGGAGKGFGDF